MTPPIAVQLYTVRDLLSSDFAGTIEQIAGMGYIGVEAGGFPPEITVETAAKIIQEAGLKVVGAHLPLPLGDHKMEVLDSMAAFGCTHLVSPWMDPGRYENEASIKKLANEFNEAAEVAMDNGLKLSIHNHWFEFERVDGIPAYQILLKYLSREVLFEIDIYWVKTAGGDPAQVLSELGPRAPLVHVKDGPADSVESPMVAVGQGSLDMPTILSAGGAHTEVHIVELDRCATDMLTAVKESYEYLTGNGISTGNK